MDAQPVKWGYERGRAEFRLGRPMPPRPVDHEGNDEVLYRWLGYMMERADYIRKCWAVHDALNDPDPHDPRPPKALAA